jgi:hypothetical protein
LQFELETIMKSPEERNDIDRSRRALISTAAAASVAGLGASFGLAHGARAEEAKPMLMFVQIAEDLKADPAAKTFRLVNVSQQTVYFADRPVRIAGHIKMADYLKEWTSKAGKDNFAKDPPNATLSVYEPGQANNKIAVVTISNPKVEGADLVYNYKLIDGTVPVSGGATSLFIDWIGVGGGVGVGFHGVGVGFRGR